MLTRAASAPAYYVEQGAVAAVATDVSLEVVGHVNGAVAANRHVYNRPSSESRMMVRGLSVSRVSPCSSVDLRVVGGASRTVRFPNL